MCHAARRGLAWRPRRSCDRAASEPTRPAKYNHQGGDMIRVAFIIGDYPPEERRLREEVARSYSTAEVEVGILSVKPSPFGGLSPAEIQLVAPYFHAAYLQAEQEGYD